MSKINLTPKEKVILGNYIIAHCKIPDGAQYAKWDEESGSDITVSEKLRAQIPRLNFGHVRNMRQAFDLPLEPARLVWVKPHNHAEKLSELEALRDKLEAMAAHVKECDVRLKEHIQLIRDHETRLQAVEDKYTSPKEDSVRYSETYAEECERAADKAVAEHVDPRTEKTHPVRLWRKGKHHGHANH